MGTILTTATFADASHTVPTWIFTPGEMDGETAGLAWSTSARSMEDMMDLLGYERLDLHGDGDHYPIDAFLISLEEAIEATDFADDYMMPMLMKSKTVLINGQALGATLVVVVC